ncbi:plastid-lipid-associated protein 6, chloroplastic isoform X2 [Phalaenopsis equestris]|uniref:plastid-lipid-associated protein 6, chloroplastic isoform X2 n=1 Tax=Phalaenopsis equestris TaxID=78828 RepID=UPI0009E2232F|nr:plastid-lipid-associated protein 6, chloroplastic isoform X2 [Phalaenopsis equestris]
MAAPIPSSIISCSLLCSASSSTSLRCALSFPVGDDFHGGLRQRILNSKSLSSPRRRRNEDSVWRTALNELPAVDPLPSLTNPSDVTSLKLKLLSIVSGLNRGLAASEEDLRMADSAAKELEAAGGPVVLTKDLDNLQGKWKLIYSSAFSSRSLGGSRPGPPTGRLIPITLGQVFQRIDILSKDFDNIVELQFSTPWPLPQIEATATLAHKFELIGTSKVKITFEKTSVKPSGNLSQLPPFEIPRLPDALRSPSNTRSGKSRVDGRKQVDGPKQASNRFWFVD